MGGTPWCLAPWHLLQSHPAHPCPSQGQPPAPCISWREQPPCRSARSSTPPSQHWQTAFSHHMRKTLQQKGSDAAGMLQKEAISPPLIISAQCGRSLVEMTEGGISAALSNDSRRHGCSGSSNPESLASVGSAFENTWQTIAKNEEG